MSRKGLLLKTVAQSFCVFSKVFGKLVNNRMVDDIEKGSFFSDFQYGFRSS